MQRTFRMELKGLPDPRLSPNAKNIHRLELNSIKGDIKKYLLKDKKNPVQVPDQPFKQAHITITFIAVPARTKGGKRYGRDPRGRDLDNLFCSMKAYIDALVSGGVLVNDSVEELTYTIQYQRGDADNTIIEVKEVM